MTPESPESDPLSELRRLWARDHAPAPALDPRALERATRRLRRRVWARNLTEWSAAAVLVPLCVDGVLHGTRLGTRLGLVAIAIAGVYVSAELYRRGRLGQKPASASTAEFLQAHVHALGRQAELLEGVWRWYLLPFVPGITLIYTDAARAVLVHPGGAHAERLLLVLGGWLFTGLVFAGIGLLNRRGARALRREMAALTGP